MKDNRTKPMKICDSHKCSNCPIRGTECLGVVINNPVDKLTKKEKMELLVGNKYYLNGDI